MTDISYLSDVVKEILSFKSCPENRRVNTMFSIAYWLSLPPDKISKHANNKCSHLLNKYSMYLNVADYNILLKTIEHKLNIIVPVMRFDYNQILQILHCAIKYNNIDIINQLEQFYDTKQIVKKHKLYMEIYKSCDYQIILYYFDYLKSELCCYRYENIEAACINNNVDHIELMLQYYGDYITINYFQCVFKCAGSYSNLTTIKDILHKYPLFHEFIFDMVKSLSCRKNVVDIINFISSEYKLCIKSIKLLKTKFYEKTLHHDLNEFVKNKYFSKKCIKL